MYQCRRNELKAIARDLGIEPDGDRRKIETWELAIERAAQSMGISVEAACNPLLRFYALGEHNGLSDDQIEEAIEQITEKHYFSSSKRGIAEAAQKRAFRQVERFAKYGWVHDPSELIAENSPGIDCVQESIELAAESSPGVDFAQESIELAVESSPGVDFAQELGVDFAQEPIELAAESFSGVDFAQESIELAVESSPGVDFAQEPIELAVESSPGVDFAQELGVDFAQEPIELAAESFSGVDFAQESIELAVESFSGVDFAQEPIELAAESFLGVDFAQEPIACDSILPQPLIFLIEFLSEGEGFDVQPLTLTVADAWNPADFGEVLYKADASGQLNLFEWEVSEPLDPDDYPSIAGFQQAWDAWSLENPEIEPIDLPAENIPGVFSDIGTVETVSLESMCQWAPCDQLFTGENISVQSGERCFCGQAFAHQCDGRTVIIRVYLDRVKRLFCYKTRNGSNLVGGRSPPGGDLMA
ncbi:hypothetical protein [Microcoleus sp. Aus8_D3]|uniref:hypothetical protein n=1 Tax=Microcoleus sp. Aus8_D3 TaxID=2818633 RepID=UPI002FD3A030